MIRTPAQNPAQNHAFNPGTPLLNWNQSAALVKEKLTALAEADAAAGWHALAPPSDRTPAAATMATSAGVGTRRRLRGTISHRFRGLLAGGQPNPVAEMESPGESETGEDAEEDEGDSTVEGSLQGVGESATEAVAGTEGSGITSLPTALLAVATANVWDKTDKMLQSLALCRDRFELLVLTPNPGLLPHI